LTGKERPLLRSAARSQAVIEVKDPSRVDSDEVRRKRRAAEMWCKQRRMEYVIATIER